MAKYDKKSQSSVKSAMHRRKKGKLKSGSGQTVKSRKQAIAIGLSEARAKGAKVPAKKSSSSKRSKGQRGPVSKRKSTTTRKKRTTSKSKSK